MTKKNRILSLIDFSDNSESLIKFSSEFSKIIDSEVIFVHQILAAAPVMADLETRKILIEIEKNKALEKLKALTKKQYFKAAELFASDKTILGILDELKNDTYFDWAFVGLKGTGFLKKIFIGSTALKVIEDSELLTVAIPIQKEIFIPSRLVVSVYYKYPINIAQFNLILSNLSEQNKEIEFITVITEKDNEDKSINYLIQLKLMYSEYNATINPFRGKDAFSEIINHMEDKKDSFLVVQQGSRSLTDSLFRKFLINDLVYSSSIPLIVLSK